MSRYLLVSSQEAFEAYEKLFPGSVSGDTVYVASTSRGMIACERAQVTYGTLDQYSPKGEIIGLGWDNYFSLTSFCEHWDEVAQELFPGLKDRSIRPFRFGYYDLKILVDSISTKILMLENFLLHAGGREIYYLPETGKRIAAGEFLRPCGDVNMFSLLLESLFAGKANLLPLPPRKGPKRIALQSRLKAAIQPVRARLPGVRNAARFLGAHGRRREGKGYLCISYGHDIQDLVPYLAKRHLQLIPMPGVAAYPGPETVEQCAFLCRKLLTDKAFGNHFSCKGIGYFALIRDLLAEYIKSVLPRAVAEYDYFRQAISRLDVQFLLTGSINLGLVNRCRMLAAQANGAPLITYAEGAGYGSIISPIYDFTEMQDGDAMLCYGSGNSEYYEDLGTAKKAIIPVGSAHQDAVREKLTVHAPPGAIQSVMYVGTVVDDNVMHCPNNGLVSTFYCSTQVKIFRLLASLPADRHMVAKPNPHDSFTPALLGLAEFRRVRVENRPFEKVMDGVGLFILDFPSTVLLSCIATSAYVFVLAEAGVTGLTEKQKERLEKRAYLFEDFDSLAVAVRKIMQSTAEFPVRMDDSYMLAYSLHRPDGKSAERAAAVLAEFPRGGHEVSAWQVLPAG